MKEIQRHLNLFLLIDVSSDRSYFGNSIPRLLEGSEGNKEEEKKKKKKFQTWTRAGARPLYLLNLQLRNFIMKAPTFLLPFFFFFFSPIYDSSMPENVTIGDLAFWESARTQNVTHVWIKVYAEVSCF